MSKLRQIIREEIAREGIFSKKKYSTTFKGNTPLGSGETKGNMIVEVDVQGSLFMTVMDDFGKISKVEFLVDHVPDVIKLLQKAYKQG